MANVENVALSWDSVIENDGQDFVLLPPGEYSYTVVGFERKQFDGNDKAPACPMAKLTLECAAEDGTTARVTDTLFLSSRNEWRLCEFFTSIGQRQHGDKLQPRWNEVLGAKGTLKLNYDEKNKNDDGSPKYNRVEKYMEPAARPQKKWQMGV